MHTPSTSQALCCIAYALLLSLSILSSAVSELKWHLPAGSYKIQFENRRWTFSPTSLYPVSEQIGAEEQSYSVCETSAGLCLCSGHAWKRLLQPPTEARKFLWCYSVLQTPSLCPRDWSLLLLPCRIRWAEVERIVQLLMLVPSNSLNLPMCHGCITLQYLVILHCSFIIVMKVPINTA